MTDHKIINPIHAREDEYVDIHWRLKTGTVYVERRTCPPPPTTSLNSGSTCQHQYWDSGRCVSCLRTAAQVRDEEGTKTIRSLID